MSAAFQRRKHRTRFGKDVFRSIGKELLIEHRLSGGKAISHIENPELRHAPDFAHQRSGRVARCCGNGHAAHLRWEATGNGWSWLDATAMDMPANEDCLPQKRKRPMKFIGRPSPASTDRLRVLPRPQPVNDGSARACQAQPPLKPHAPRSPAPPPPPRAAPSGSSARRPRAATPRTRRSGPAGSR